MVFYYVYWEFEQKYTDAEHRWHDCNRFNSDILLLSVTLLRQIYPESQIKIIVYNEIPQSFELLKIFSNVSIINLQPYVDIKQKNNQLLHIKDANCKNSHLLLSKPIDVFNLAKQNKENFALLDVDFFVFKPFENLDFSKVGFLFYNKDEFYVNTGLIASGTESFECNYFFELYESFIKIFDHQNENIKNKIIYNVYNTYGSLQEEIVMCNITQKFQELKDLIFYDVTERNHRLYYDMIELDFKNNMHAYKLPKKRICKVLTNVNYIKNVLAKKELKLIRDRLYGNLDKSYLNHEEHRLFLNLEKTIEPQARRILI